MADTSSIAPFSSVHSFSKWVRIFYIISISLTVIFSISLLMEINLLSSMTKDISSVTDEEIEANDLRNLVIGIVSVPISIIALILFFIWYHKVYRNLPSLGGKELKTSPKWSVIYFFIPILWFYKPYQTTKEIWKVSDPTVTISDINSRKQMKTPSLIKTWWAFWIISGIIGWFYLRSLQYSISADTLEGIRAFDTIDLVTNVPIIISDLLTFFLVKEITSRQEKKNREMKV